MSPGNVAYLVLVVAGFSTFAVVLFSASFWTNRSDWFPSRATKPLQTVESKPKPAPYSKAA